MEAGRSIDTPCSCRIHTHPEGCGEQGKEQAACGRISRPGVRKPQVKTREASTPARMVCCDPRKAGRVQHVPEVRAPTVHTATKAFHLHTQQAAHHQHCYPVKPCRWGQESACHASTQATHAMANAPVLMVSELSHCSQMRQLAFACTGPTGAPDCWACCTGIRPGTCFGGTVMSKTPSAFSNTIRVPA